MRKYKRGSYWYIDYTFQGKRIRKEVSRSEKVADLVMKDIEVKIAKEEYLGIKPKEKILLKDFIQKYLEYSKANKTFHYYQEEKNTLENRLVPFFNGKCLDEITVQDVEKYKSDRIKEVKPATINRDLACLKHLYNKAIDWNLTEFNPVKKVRFFKEPPGRVRYLSSEEINRLLTNCPEQLKPVVIVALNTGLRRSEIFNLKWENIDFRNRILMVEMSKNNEKRAVPINQIVYELLHKYSRAGEYIFNVSNSRRLFEKAVEDAKIKDFKFHDLRHTFASYLAMSGCNLKTIQELMGHKDIRMTIRYSHLSKEYLKEAIEKPYKNSGIEIFNC